MIAVADAAASHLETVETVERQIPINRYARARIEIKGKKPLVCLQCLRLGASVTSGRPPPVAQISAGETAATTASVEPAEAAPLPLLPRSRRRRGP